MRLQLLVVLTIIPLVHLQNDYYGPSQNVKSEPRQIYRDDVKGLKGYSSYSSQDSEYAYEPQKPYDSYGSSKPPAYDSYGSSKPPAYDSYGSSKPPAYDGPDQTDYGYNQPTYQTDEYNDKPQYDDGTPYQPTYSYDDNENTYDDEPEYPFNSGPPAYTDESKNNKPYLESYANQYSKPYDSDSYGYDTYSPQKGQNAYTGYKQVVLLKPGPAVKQNSLPSYPAAGYERPNAIPGTAGKDYPNYSSVPVTSFDCLQLDQIDYNYLYADRETGCQVFHSCHPDGRMDSRICPIGTVFDATTQICDWWFSVQC